MLRSLLINAHRLHAALVGNVFSMISTRNIIAGVTLGLLVSIALIKTRQISR
jgi:hypothetical protein